MTRREPTTGDDGVVESSPYGSIVVAEAWRRPSQWARLVGTRLFGFDAFVSHAHADGAPYAHQLFDELRRSGVTVCLDRLDFLLGDQLEASLDNVKRSHVLLLVDTPAARISPWVAHEVRRAAESDLRVVRIPIGVSDEVNAAEWPQLASEDDAATLARLRGAISCREPQPGATGVVSAVVLGDVRRTLRTLTTRRRLVLGFAMAAVATLLAGTAYMVGRVASLQLQAATREVSAFDQPLERSASAAARYLSSWWATLAERLYPDPFDAAMQDMIASTVIRPSSARRATVAYGSANGRVELAASGTTPEIWTLRGSVNDRCTPGLSGVAGAAVANSGERLMVVTAEATSLRVTLWDVLECRAASTTVIAGASDGAALRAVVADEAGRSFAIAWPAAVSWLWLDEHRLVERRWTPAPPAPGAPGDIDDVWISSSGRTLAVALGVDAPSWFCVASRDWRPEACSKVPRLTSVALDPNDRYVITGDDDGVVATYAIGAHAAGTAQHAALYSRMFGFESIGIASHQPIIVGLKPTDAGLEASYLELPTLTVVARAPVVASSRSPRGEVRVLAANVGPPEPVAPSTCAATLTALAAASVNAADGRTNGRAGVLDYANSTILAMEGDCQAVVVGHDARVPNVVEVWERSAPAAWRLVHRRTTVGAVRAVRLLPDSGGGRWMKAAVDLTPSWAGMNPIPWLWYDIPLSRDAVRQHFSEAAHALAHWSVPVSKACRRRGVDRSDAARCADASR